MQRLIYNLETNEIIEIIDPCEGTVTGTPYEIFEGEKEDVDQLIIDLQLESRNY